MMWAAWRQESALLDGIGRWQSGMGGKGPESEAGVEEYMDGDAVEVAD